MTGPGWPDPDGRYGQQGWQDPYGQQGQQGQQPSGQPGQPSPPPGTPPPGYGQGQAGWQDPYGPAQPSGQGQGYGVNPQPVAYGSGPPPIPAYVPRPMYGPPPPPPPTYTNGSAIGALCANIIFTAGNFFACFLGIAGMIPSIIGIVLAGMGMAEKTNRERGQKLALWSWICFALAIVLMVVSWIVLVLWWNANFPSSYDEGY